MQTFQLQQKTIRLTNAQRVMAILSWNELEYSTFMHETGLQYLELYIPNDRQGMDALNRSRIFWNWWKNHWAIRDQQYLDEMDKDSEDSWRPKVLYGFYHSAYMLSSTIYPNAVVLENSYANMIGRFNKSLTPTSR